MPFTIFHRWFTFCLIFMATLASANEITVFDVRKNFPMKNGEKVYRDYYINAGAESGLKRDMIVHVNRRRALYDAYQNRSLGNLLVPVGKLRVIHVQQGMSVARLYSTFSRENIPGLEYDFILVGDLVDMTTAKFESKSRNHKSAEQEVESRKVAMVQPVPVPAPAAPKPVAPELHQPQIPTNAAQ